MPKGITIFIPEPVAFGFKPGRDAIRKRAKMLNKLNSELCDAKVYIAKEKQYLHNSCVGHVYKSTGDGDGSSQDWCDDCGFRR